MDLAQPPTCFGWRPDGRFYTTDALARAMSSYNSRLSGICARLNVECIDLASRIPRSLESFYDDMHFTEIGARRVADELIAHFRMRAPFSGRTIVREHGSPAAES
jgi:hypothetical protein